MKAIGYIRVSTTRQDLERQKKLIQDYCIIKNYEIIDIYSDKQTGATSNREGYIKLLQTNKSMADVIIVSELSRLSREDEIMNTLTQINMILQNGLDVVFLDDESKTYKGGSSLALVDIITLSVKAQQAADERKKIKTRMITGRKSKAVSFANMFTGGRVPYGYKRVANPDYKTYITPKTFLQRDEKEANVISDIYNWIIEGSSLRDVARRLQENGIKSNLNNDFSAITILNMVKNTIYKGVWKFQNELFNGDAIVTETIWQQANDAIKNRALRPATNAILHFNPLRGIIKCPCGKSMTIAPINDRHIYRCTTKKDKYDKKICSNGSISSDLLLYAVWRCVKLVVSMEEYITKSGEEVSNRQLEIEEINRIVDLKNKEILQLQEEQNNLVDSLATITDEKLRNRIETRYKEKEYQIYELNNDIKKIGKKKISLMKLIEQINRHNGEKFIDELTEEQKRNIYLRELERVTFFSNKRMRGFLVVKFKNGYERVMLLRSRKEPDVFLLPPTFTMNHTERKIQVDFLNKGFDMNRNVKLFDSVELEEAFELSEWRI